MSVTPETIVLETDRLRLRHLSDRDAAFIFELLNDPSWIRFIGQKNIDTLEAAKKYIQNGPLKMIEAHGFGLYLVELKEGSIPVGLCGLIKREGLADVDVGFAFLPAHWGRGYAYESAHAVVEYGKKQFGLDRVVAITTEDNTASLKVLTKLGLSYEKTIRLPGDTVDLLLLS